MSARESLASSPCASHGSLARDAAIVRRSAASASEGAQLTKRSKASASSSAAAPALSRRRARRLSSDVHVRKPLESRRRNATYRYICAYKVSFLYCTRASLRC